MSADAAALLTFGTCATKFGTFTAVADPSSDSKPVNCVNFYDAAAFCLWDGGWLPADEDWNYAAAGGSEQRTYPWGSDAPGNDALRAVYGCLLSGGASCGAAEVADVGSIPLGKGRYGQSDLGGNVAEWTLGNFGATRRLVRGGSWEGDALLLKTSSSSNALEPAVRDRDTGFRCARAF